MKLSKMGASLDVKVNREYTSFVVTGLSKDALEHASIVSDVVKNSVFDESAIEKERSNIFKYLEKEEDNYPQVVMDYLYSVAYEGTPMSHSLTGTGKNIELITRQDIFDFIDKNYKAPRMLLTSVGGNTSLDALAEVAEKNLTGVSSAYTGGMEYPKPCRFTAMEVNL